jgi:hypothetical protein
MSGFRISSLKDGKYFAIDSNWEDEYKGKKGSFFSIKGNGIYMEELGKLVKLQMSIYEFVSQFSPEEIIKVED